MGAGGQHHFPFLRANYNGGIQSVKDCQTTLIIAHFNNNNNNTDTNKDTNKRKTLVVVVNGTHE